MTDRTDTVLARRQILAAVPALALAGLAGPALAQRVTDQQSLIDQAELTISGMLDNPGVPDFRPFVRDAQAVLVFPRLIRGSFFFGGEGGNGIMMARRGDGSWSDPGFVIIAAGSFGLQFGGQVSSVLLTVMTRRGVNAILERRVALGADLNVAVLSEGVGVDARYGLDYDADMYAFSMNQGLFIGGAVEGSTLIAQDDWTRAYYGGDATLRHALTGAVSNPGAGSLKSYLARVPTLPKQGPLGGPLPADPDED